MYYEYIIHDTSGIALMCGLAVNRKCVEPSCEAYFRLVAENLQPTYNIRAWHHYVLSTEFRMLRVRKSVFLTLIDSFENCKMLHVDENGKQEV
jgi:hypothetical protein